MRKTFLKIIATLTMAIAIVSTAANKAPAQLREIIDGVESVIDKANERAKENAENQTAYCRCKKLGGVKGCYAGNGISVRPRCGYVFPCNNDRANGDCGTIVTES